MALKSLLKLPAVMKATSWSRPKIYAEMAAGNFPKPDRTGNQSVAWIEDEVAEWQDRIFAERDRKADSAR